MTLQEAKEYLKNARLELDEARSGMYIAASTFGSAFRYEREKRGLTLKKAAREIGISQTFLGDIEHGRRIPNRKVTSFFL